MPDSPSSTDLSPRRVPQPSARKVDHPYNRRSGTSGSSGRLVVMGRAPRHHGTIRKWHLAGKIVGGQGLMRAAGVTGQAGKGAVPLDDRRTARTAGSATRTGARSGRVLPD